ncbi:hypothetical protein M2R48_14165 [Acinetobacter sp. I-MWF]|uniref:hypothetical protein n=1 Tax=Acinetobacter sp. I-MWF TaxID=2940517 RepID=UPI0021C5B226|nr:hypothetical protein [Acinetobacter sp. I-MWF]MCT9979478.1 hypothetical protein [Acinetobacter sp. I-MWF]
MMEAQVNILNELAKILHYSSGSLYDSAHLEYKFNPDEGWRSISMWYENEGKTLPPKQDDADQKNIDQMCKQLHDEMQSHTGGDWRKFILTIDEQGKAKTQFIYEIQSCMDEFND